MKLVPIEQVLTSRTLAPDDDLTALSKHIQDSGLKVPILVDTEYRLIDGLRRLEAMRRLGFTQVEVTATTLYPVACQSLKRARQHGVEALPLTARRVWQLYNDMIPLLRATKTHYMTGRKKGTGARASAGGRPMFTDALGLHSESYLQAVTQVFRAAEDPKHALHERALTAVVMLEADPSTPYPALHYMKQKPGLKGGITKYKEQKDLLEGAAAAIRGLMRGLMEMGSLDSKYPTDEARSAVNELARLRTQLNKFLKNVNEEINKR